MDETVARAVIFATLCTALVLIVMLVKRVWRALRRVNVEAVAHTAGALTDAAQRRAASITRAFKDGRRH